ncbi:MAG: Type I HSP40 co-chaperone [Cyphobasidiales sp. Tagirdzhanova-0007]|nr:MAG: Type I HSP40 co-chaperone [Cyphobasidiales sp. Tagirdzhanova-0007]
MSVSKDADDARIKTAYKKLALKHHPDRNPGKEEEASNQFKDVSRAFEVLSDPQTRARYDQFGEEGLEGGGGMGGMGGMDPQDLFSQLFGGGGGGGFFGGGGRSRPQGPRKGKDLVHRIKVSLEDLYKGKTTKLALQKHVLCAKCNGKGGKEGAVKTCHGCNGQGIKVVLRQMGPMVQQLQQTCPDCNGEGEIINAKDKCKTCLGKKVNNERKVLEVNIDKGMKDGQTVTFPGEADQAPNVIPGDVVIAVEEKPHERFKRKGDDLYMEVTIDLLTALAGGRFFVEHLDDRALQVNIMPGEIIKPGAIKVISEQGMPAFRHHNHGQLILSFAVQFPESLPTEALTHLEKALPARPKLPKLPKDHMIDEVILEDADLTRQARARAADDMEEDEDGQQQPPGVSCQNQ